MVALSKVFRSPHNCFDCVDYLRHDGFTCTQLFFYNCFRGAISSGRYFLPLAISPIVLRAKKLNLSLLIEILEHYFISVVWAATSGALTFGIICFLRKLFGRFYYYTSALIPSYIAFQLAWALPLRNLRMFGTGTTQAVLETILHRHKNSWARLITESKFTRTFLFMLSSTVVMHFKRCKEYSGFWFLQPIPKDSTAKDNNLSDIKKSDHHVHPGSSCKRFIFTGMKSYLIYGIPLDILNVIMRGKLPKSFTDIVGKLKQMSFNTTCFFLSYIGIYRLSLCILARYSHGGSDMLEHALSAFLSGVSYIFLGKLTIVVLAAVLAVQAFWHHFCHKNFDAVKHPLLVWLQKVPVFRLLLPFNLAYLIHSYIFCNENVSSLAKGFLNGATNGRIERVYQFLLRYFATLP